MSVSEPTPTVARLLANTIERQGRSGEPPSVVRPIKVAVTGSRGRVGSLLVPLLSSKFDVLELDSSLEEGPHVRVDIGDLDVLTAAFAGLDAVVHLAARAPWRSTFEEVLQPNIVGTYNVFEAARRAGVRKVVFASSNHVTGMYDQAGAWPVDSTMPVRPDGMYGVSKAFGEALGRYYSDAHRTSVICLRIGWVRANPSEDAADTGVDTARMMWLSAQDLGDLVTRSLLTDVKFGIYYGVSNNSTRHWDLSNAEADLGYRPGDDSALAF